MTSACVSVFDDEIDRHFTLQTANVAVTEIVTEFMNLENKTDKQRTKERRDEHHSNYSSSIAGYSSSSSSSSNDCKL